MNASVVARVGVAAALLLGVAGGGGDVVAYAVAAEPGGDGAPGALAPALKLTLPFDGVWGVVQGFDSGDTHTGYAAFALDFAPPQDVGQFAHLAHPRLADFACYGRPILAPADGTVVRVAAGFPDRENFVGLKDKGQLTSASEAAAKVLAFLRRADFGSNPVADVRDV